MWYNGRTDDRFTGSIGLATSDDGLRWTKANNGQPVFKHGSPGTFDSTKVDHPAGDGSCLADFNVVSHFCEVIGR